MSIMLLKCLPREVQLGRRRRCMAIMTMTTMIIVTKMMISVNSRHRVLGENHIAYLGSKFDAFKKKLFWVFFWGGFGIPL